MDPEKDQAELNSNDPLEGIDLDGISLFTDDDDGGASDGESGATEPDNAATDDGEGTAEGNETPTEEPDSEGQPNGSADADAGETTDDKADQAQFIEFEDENGEKQKITVESYKKIMSDSTQNYQRGIELKKELDVLKAGTGKPTKQQQLQSKVIDLIRTASPDNFKVLQQIDQLDPAFIETLPPESKQAAYELRAEFGNLQREARIEQGKKIEEYDTFVQNSWGQMTEGEEKDAFPGAKEHENEIFEKMTDFVKRGVYADPREVYHMITGADSAKKIKAEMEASFEARVKEQVEEVLAARESEDQERSASAGAPGKGGKPGNIDTEIGSMDELEDIANAELKSLLAS